MHRALLYPATEHDYSHLRMRGRASWLMPVPELMKLQVLATNSNGKKEELTLPGVRLSNSVAHVKRQLELLTSKPPDGQRLSLSAANWCVELIDQLQAWCSLRIHSCVISSYVRA